MVTATVRPASGRAAPKLEAAIETPSPAPSPALIKALKPPSPRLKPIAARPAPPADTKVIEPRRKHRIARGREIIEARLDLHGLDQDRARARLLHFLLDAQAEGARAVLVITGKGYSGQGVLRRRTPEWLADPRLREVVAGLSPAEAHHGGEGAFYVALKRRPR